MQKIISNINKNAELLEEYHKYKMFLDKVSSAGTQQPEPEEPKVENPSTQQKSARGEKGTGNKKKPQKPKKKDNLLDDLNIKKEINDLIDDDDKYEIPFKTSDDLISNFTTLEEKNLFLIQQTQEAEQAYEEK